MDHTPHPYNAGPPRPDLSPEAAQDAARTDRNLDILDEMIGVGVELVRRARVTLEVSENQEANLTQAERCARLVRAVERAVALSTWIIKDRRHAAAHHQHQAVEAAATRRTERKTQLNHAMREAIKAAPREKAGALIRRYEFRMHDWDIEQDLAHHSVEAAITRLCTELGIPPPPPYTAPAAPAAAPPAARSPATAHPTPRPDRPAATIGSTRTPAFHDPP